MADAFSPLHPSEQASPTATETIDARQWLTAGWYWAFLDPGWESSTGWTEFSKKNPGVKTTKTVGSLEKGSWVLFNVPGPQPVIWTLPGFPTKAFKGAATEYSDVIDQSQNEPSTASQLEEFLGSIGKQLGSAGQVLLWGGVAVLLWQLYQHTSSSSGGSPAVRRLATREEGYDNDTSDDEPATYRTHTPRPRRTRSGTLVSHYR